MMGIILTLAALILILIAVFGGLCLITGEEDKGNKRKETKRAGTVAERQRSVIQNTD